MLHLRFPVGLTTIARVLCMLSVLLISTHGFFRPVTHSSRGMFATLQQQGVVEVPALIDRVIAHFEIHKCADGLDPHLLIDNLHVLCKPGVYERSMLVKLQTKAGAEDMAHVRAADDFLRNYVAAERKKRVRLKLNYILAGAESGRLDEAVQLLSETEELDSDLLTYVRELAKQPQNSVGGAEVTPAQSIFKLVRDRLEAEVQLGNKAEVQLLAQLLAEKDYAERGRQLKLRLRRVEDIEAFRSFVADGIAHLSSQQTPVRSREELVALPADTVEKMKDLLHDVDQLRETLATGLATADTFSTAAEDYVPPA